MTESEPKPEKRNIIHNALVEVLDFAERGRETVGKWWRNNIIRTMNERENDYAVLLEYLEDRQLNQESKRQKIDEFNKKYGTDYTLSYLLIDRLS
jgi:hypothetical protein